MSRKVCVNNPDRFYYICGKYMLSKHIFSINDSLKERYYDYFNREITHQDKSWVPHKSCKSCVEVLRSCTNKNFIKYPNVPSVTKPTPRSSMDPLPVPQKSGTSQKNFQYEEQASNEDNNVMYDLDSLETTPRLYDQAALNDLVRDLDLSKEKAELLGSRLKKRNLLLPKTSFSWYRSREKEFSRFFIEEDSLVFCNDVSGLLDKYGIKFNSADWRFFINSSKRSLKGVLLHNGNRYASIPIVYSAHLKESYTNMNLVFQSIRYDEHKWKVCGDLKAIGMILGQQTGQY
ncbi:hypothetical protein ALC57_16739 [Trachymyrmex cornetzi]|uniref:Uncharacterized protein n=1 Tax=Trachymyrmex cornetzi TaxID=471704 RepID=A0A151IV12_9HYME|nr:hypothetical protein ALC57_16739 [Trachymyrmex cornetzi]